MADSSNADLDKYTPYEALEHFRQDPHLSRLISSPLYEPIVPFQHIDDSGPTDEILNEFFVKTLSTPTSIAHCVNLRLRSLPPIPSLESTDLGLPHTLWLFAFGTSAISGKFGMAHGGFLSAILDETLSRCAEVQQGAHANDDRLPMYTAKLELAYKKALSVPANYVVRAWVVNVEGRKRWVKGQIVNPEGTEVFTEGRAMCIQAKMIFGKL